MPTKICPQCNKEFFTKHKHVIHCSSQCSGLSRRTHSFEKVCEYCKKDYVSKHKTQKFCSAKCQGNAIKTRKMVKCSNCNKDILQINKNNKNVFCDRNCYLEFHKMKFETRNCKGCGKEITRPLTQLKYDNNYCSDECRSNKDKVLECIVCKTKFCSIQYRKANNKKGFTIIRPFRNTCSDKCIIENFKTNEARKEKISIAFSGANHPNYVNGASYNGRLRKTDLKEYFGSYDKKIVFKKFNNKCFKCGATENLTIDHNMPFSRGGKLTETNAVLLCRSCNSKKNAKLPTVFYTNKELKALDKMGINHNNIFNFLI